MGFSKFQAAIAMLGIADDLRKMSGIWLARSRYFQSGETGTEIQIHLAFFQ
jgi:hypothetical protein